MLTTEHGAPVLTDEATREEIVEALTLAAAGAARTLSRDRWGNPHNGWAARHRFINRLLDMLDQCDSP